MGAARVVCTDRVVGVVNLLEVASCVAYARVLYVLYVCDSGYHCCLADRCTASS